MTNMRHTSWVKPCILTAIGLSLIGCIGKTRVRDIQYVLTYRRIVISYPQGFSFSVSRFDEDGDSTVLLMSSDRRSSLLLGSSLKLKGTSKTDFEKFQFLSKQLNKSESIAKEGNFERRSFGGLIAIGENLDKGNIVHFDGFLLIGDHAFHFALRGLSGDYSLSELKTVLGNVRQAEPQERETENDVDLGDLNVLFPISTPMLLKRHRSGLRYLSMQVDPNCSFAINEAYPRSPLSQPEITRRIKDLERTMEGDFKVHVTPAYFHKEEGRGLFEGFELRATDGRLSEGGILSIGNLNFLIQVYSYRIYGQPPPPVDTILRKVSVRRNLAGH